MSLQEEGIECIQKRRNSSRRVRRYSQCRKQCLMQNKNERFTIYSTLEPCPMCTGGILFAKIQRVVWLLNDDLGFGGYKR